MANKKTILIMGETGSGKSTFINSVFGEDTMLEKPAPVGADSFSCTKDVEEFLYERKDGVVISLVDSPGFNNFGNGQRSDADIVELMTGFLKPRDGEPDHGPGVFSGVVFLHSINSLNPAELPGKTMRQLKVLCGKGQLNNKFIVATNRWEECQSDDLDDQSSEEEMLEILLDSNKTLKEFHDAGVNFVRTCSFNDRATLPGNSDQFKSPRAIVEQLLGLGPDEDLTVNVGATSHSQSRVLVLADELEPFKKEQIWDASEDSQSATNHAQSHEKPVNQHLNGQTERSCDTSQDSQDSQSVINYAESEQTLTNEDNQCTDEQEWPFLDFGNHLKEDPQISLFVTVLRTFADHQTQELKKMHAAMLKGHDLLNNQVVELKQALALSQEQSAEQLKSEKTSKLETECELESTKDILREAKEEVKARDQDIAQLRQQVQVQATERKALAQEIASLKAELKEGKERVQCTTTPLETMLLEEKKKSGELGREVARLRTQLEDGTRRITSLESELEQGRKKAEEQACVNEVHSQHVACLEQELQESKTMLGTLLQESTHLGKEAQDISSRRFSTGRNVSLEHDLAPFINSVFGEDPKLEKPAVVGAESFSCTKKVEEFLYEHKDGLSISLVDSPGFDNFEDGPDSKSDAEIMEMMIDFLKSRDGESEHGPGVFSGVVFLHSINSLNPAELPGKTMRQLKVLCGKDQLNNKFIVATNRWEDFQCDDLDDQSSEEEMLELLLDSNKTLKELHDAGVKFVRTCSLNYRVTPPGNSYEFKSPRAIVEQLLGLEHEEDLMVNVEATRTSDSHSRVLADETEPVKEERKWTLEDSPSVTNHANSQQAETNEQPLGQHLNGHTERSYDTPEDSQSATSCAESEQAETNEDPSQCTDEREWPFLDFGDRLKEDPQMSLLVTVLKSFADRQTQELKSMHAAMLKMLGSQVVELKQALGLSHQQPINPVSGLRGQTKSERDRIDTSKETKEEFEARDQELAGLWQKVQAQGAERELVRLRTQLQDGTRRIASLETELEQEREKAEKQARVNEALSQQVACLEQELQTSKTTEEACREDRGQAPYARCPLKDGFEGEDSEDSGSPED
ncbi:hypothetical protein MD484_g4673, partial [Candolleomyces efflorescens]